MATINRFEDIEAWKEARKITAEIYAICQQKPLALDFGLCDQLRRSSVSIMANIAEGFGRGGNREFLQLLSLARSSASELKSHLYVLIDTQHLNQETFQRLYEQTSRIEVLLSKFMNYLQTSTLRGQKFKSTQDS